MPEDIKMPKLPKVGPITYAMRADVEQYKTPRVGPHLPGVFDEALWSTDQMRDYARAAVIADREARQQWQPIETAPKSPEFRCLLAHTVSVVTGYWNGQAWINERSRYPASDERSHFRATHWQPLPPGPFDGQRAKEE